MATDALAVSAVDAVDSASGVSKRLLRYLKVQVEDWYDVCRNLTSWEDRYLTDQAEPGPLAEHARVLDELERVGRWLSSATQSADFPDHATAELVTMTLQDLKDRRALGHGGMSRKDRELMLREMFHES